MEFLIYGILWYNFLCCFPYAWPNLKAPGMLQVENARLCLFAFAICINEMRRKNMKITYDGIIWLFLWWILPFHCLSNYSILQISEYNFNDWSGIGAIDLFWQLSVYNNENIINKYKIYIFWALIWMWWLAKFQLSLVSNYV